MINEIYLRILKSNEKNYGTLTQWTTMQQKKKGTPTLYNSMDRSGEHYAT